MINYNDQSINQAREYPETLQGVISWRRDARACSMHGNAVIGPLRGNRCARCLGSALPRPAPGQRATTPHRDENGVGRKAGVRVPARHAGILAPYLSDRCPPAIQPTPKKICQVPSPWPSAEHRRLMDGKLRLAFSFRYRLQKVLHVFAAVPHPDAGTLRALQSARAGCVAGSPAV